MALSDAEKAKTEAEAADARAEREKELADTMAHKFLAASTEARLAENFQIEKAEQVQQDQDLHKDPAVIARDQKELDASAAKAKEMKLDAAQKAADAAAFAAGVHLVTPGQITGPNLFQNAEVTNYSGKNSQQWSPTPSAIRSFPLPPGMPTICFADLTVPPAVRPFSKTDNRSAFSTLSNGKPRLR